MKVKNKSHPIEIIVEEAQTWFYEIADKMGASDQKIWGLSHLRV